MPEIPQPSPGEVLKPPMVVPVAVAPTAEPVGVARVEQRMQPGATETDPRRAFFQEMAALVQKRQADREKLVAYRKFSRREGEYYEISWDVTRDPKRFKADLELKEALEETNVRLMTNAIRITEQVDPSILKTVARNFIDIMANDPASFGPDIQKLLLPFIPAGKVKEGIMRKIIGFESRLANPATVRAAVHTEQGSAILAILDRIVRSQNIKLNMQNTIS